MATAWVDDVRQSGWVALMDTASEENPIGECAQFFFPVTLRTLDFGLFGFETNSARGGHPDRTNLGLPRSLPVYQAPILTGGFPFLCPSKLLL